jgi:hypothetical protein
VLTVVSRNDVRTARDAPRRGTTARHVTFGDGGRLYIGMPVADITAARFDRVQATVQMH